MLSTSPKNHEEKLIEKFTQLGFYKREFKIEKTLSEQPGNSSNINLSGLTTGKFFENITVKDDKIKKKIIVIDNNCDKHKDFYNLLFGNKFSVFVLTSEKLQCVENFTNLCDSKLFIPAPTANLIADLLQKEGLDQDEVVIVGHDIYNQAYLLGLGNKIDCIQLDCELIENSDSLLIYPTPISPYIHLKRKENLLHDYIEKKEPAPIMKILNEAKGLLLPPEFLVAYTEEKADLLKNLEFLNCSTIHPEFFPYLNNLKVLQVKNTVINREFIKNIKNVEILNLKNCDLEINDGDRKLILPLLKDLKILASCLNAEQLSSILHLTPSLESLQYHHKYDRKSDENAIKLTDKNIPILSYLQKLDIDFGNVRNTYFSLKSLLKPSLRHLSLENYSMEIEEKELSVWPNLEYLKINCCTLTKNFLKIILSYSKDLRHFSLNHSGLEHISFEFDNSLDKLDKLETIELSGSENDKIALPKIIEILKNSVNLKFLYLRDSIFYSANEEQKETSMKNIFSEMPRLDQLDELLISSEHAITPKNFPTFIKAFPNLKYLRIYYGDIFNGNSSAVEPLWKEQLKLSHLQKFTLCENIYTHRLLDCFFMKASNIRSLELCASTEETNDDDDDDDNSYSPKINDNEEKWIHLKNLRKLDQFQIDDYEEGNSGMKNIIFTLLEHTKSLSFLEISFDGMCDIQEKDISIPLPSLKKISGNFCLKQISYLLKTYPQIEALNFTGASYLNYYNPMNEFSEKFFSIKMINFSSNMIKREDLIKLKEIFPNANLRNYQVTDSSDENNFLSENTCSIDANTGNDENEVLKATKYFYPLNNVSILDENNIAPPEDIDPGEYFLTYFIFDDANHCLKLIDSDFSATKRSIKEGQNPLFECRYDLNEVHQGTWYPLPSLSPEDELGNFTVSSAQQSIIEEKYYTVNLCEKTNLHGICFKSSYKNIHIIFPVVKGYAALSAKEKFIPAVRRFIESAPKESKKNSSEEHSKKLEYYKKLLNLIEHCANFSAKELSAKEQQATGKDLLEIINKEQAGSCRHRSLVFAYLFDEFSKKENLPHHQCQVVMNDVHVFVRIPSFSKDKFHSVCLGGFPSRLEIHTIEKINPLENYEYTSPLSNISYDPTINDSLFLEKQFENKLKMTQPEELMHHMKNNDEYIPVFIENSVQFDFKISLKKYFKEKMLLCKPENLSAESIYLNENGALTKTSGKFVQWFNHSKNEKYLFLELLDFRPPYVQFCNTLKDRRSILEVLIPGDARVILLLSATIKHSLGPDFVRRYPTIIEMNFFSQPSLLADNIMTVHNDFLRVELFENYAYKEKLIVSYQFNGDGALKLHPGSLVTAIENKKQGIILQNPPTTREFTQWLTTLKTSHLFFYNGKYESLPKNFNLLCETKNYDFTDHDYHLSELAPNKTPSEIRAIPLSAVNKIEFFNLLRCENKITYNDAGWIKKCRNESVTYQNESLSIWILTPIPKPQLAELLQESEKYHVSLHFYGTTECLQPLINKNHNIKSVIPNKLLETNDITNDFFSEKYKITSGKLKFLVSNDFKLNFYNYYRENKEECNFFEEQIKYVPIAITEHTSFADIFGTLRNASENKEKSDLHFTFDETALTKQLKNKNPPQVILVGEISEELCCKLASAAIEKAPFIMVNGEEILLEQPIIVITAEKSLLKNTWASKTTHQYNMDDYKQYFTNLLQDATTENVAKNSTQVNEKYFPLLQELSAQGFVINADRIRFFVAQLKRYELNKNIAIDIFYPLIKLEDNIKQTCYAEIIAKYFPNKNKESTDIKLVTYNKSEAIKIVAEENEKRVNSINELLAISPIVCIIGETSVGKSYFVRNIFPQFHNKCPIIYLNPDAVKESIATWRETTGFCILFCDEVNMANSAMVAALETLLNTNSLPDSDGLPADHFILLTANPGSYRGRNKLSLFEKIPASEFTPIDSQALLWSIPAFIKDEKAYFKFINQYQEKTRGNHLPTYRDIKQAALNYCCPKIIAWRFKTLFIKNKISLKKNWEECLPAIKQALTIRDYTKDNNITPCQSGLLIEGHSGVGKSVIIDLLLKNLYEDKDSYVNLSSVCLQQLESHLITAFHEGKIVIIDEFNTVAPTIRRTLNCLLDGFDLGGKKAEKPGFYLIGTQNPSKHFAHRDGLSIDLINRLIKIEVRGKEKLTFLEKKQFGLSSNDMEISKKDKKDKKQLLKLNKDNNSIVDVNNKRKNISFLFEGGGTHPEKKLKINDKKVTKDPKAKNNPATFHNN